MTLDNIGFDPLGWPVRAPPRPRRSGAPPRPAGPVIPADVAPEAQIAALVGAIGGMATVIGFLFRLHLADDDRDRREAERRESVLVAERDAWKDRAAAAEERMGRFANAFLKLAKTDAPE